MHVCQNLWFRSTIEKDAEYEHPHGLVLMRKLPAELKAAGWLTDEIDNWRDCGWSFCCRRSSAELEVALASVPAEAWMLQISPLKVPGFIARLFGSVRSASPNDIYDLSILIHERLPQVHPVLGMRWRWDDFPDESKATPKPSKPYLPRR